MKSGCIFLKIILVLSFLLGAATYFGMAALYAGLIPKLCFCVIGVCSFLTAVGLGLTDMTEISSFRLSTRACAGIFALCLNGGALGVWVIMTKAGTSYALITAAAAVIICILTSAVLVKRYREDDF